MNKEKMKKMAEGDFDLYRNYYSLLTFEEKKTLNEAWDKLYPNQRCGNLDLMVEAMHMIKPIFLADTQVSVLELGCHDGWLASFLINKLKNISRWTGFEMTKGPIVRGMPWSSVYKPRELSVPFHKETLPKFDIFISSHCLEHLDTFEFKATLKRVRRREGKYMILDIPVAKEKEKKNKWKGYKGSHVLTMSEGEIIEFIVNLGYEGMVEKSWDNGWVTLWKLKDKNGGYDGKFNKGI